MYRVKSTKRTAVGFRVWQRAFPSRFILRAAHAGRLWNSTRVHSACESAGTGLTSMGYRRIRLVDIRASVRGSWKPARKRLRNCCFARMPTCNRGCKTNRAEVTTLRRVLHCRGIPDKIGIGHVLEKTRDRWEGDRTREAEALAG